MATPTPAAPPVGGIHEKNVLASHPLVSFFVMAYAFTWLAAFIPLALSKDGTGLLAYRWLGLYATIAIASFVGPFLSAFIMTGVTEGREGVGRLLRQLVLVAGGL